MKNILILCTGNSCRSQIADGYFSKILKNVVETMQRDKIDISNNTSNKVEEYFEINFDFIITVCDHANENCPFFPSKNAIKIHHNFFDPSKINNSKDLDFDKCRNKIKEFAINFCEKYF